MVALRLAHLYHGQEVVGSVPVAHSYILLDDAFLILLNAGALDSRRMVKSVMAVLLGSLLV